MKTGEPQEFHYRLPRRGRGWRQGSHAGSSLGLGQEFVSHRRLYDWPDPRRLDLRASETIERYVLDLWEASEKPQRFGIRLDGVDMDRLILAGASPRGMSALLRAARVVAWLAGRTHLVPTDIHAVAREALGHRIFFTPVYELRRAELSEALVAQIMDKIAAP